jgi:Xaa-Pro aminopeptidase
LDAALIVQPEHLRYFTNLPEIRARSSLVVTHDSAILVTPQDAHSDELLNELGIEAASYVWASRDELGDPDADAGRLLARALGPFLPRARIGSDAWPGPLVEDGRLTVAPAARLGPVIREWRTIKDQAELVILRREARRLDEAFQEAQGAIQEGAREADVLASAYAALAASSGDRTFRLDANVASGPRTLLGDPHATDRALNRGELVLLDLYPNMDGYVVDCTRTFAVGEPTSLQLERDAALEEALVTAEARLLPGTSVGEIDRAVRAILGRHSVDGFMGHHVGHGIGLVGWEEPWIGAGNRELVAGNVIALEPGIYIEGWGGMRTESCYVIGVDGVERLDRFPRGLR